MDRPGLAVFVAIVALTSAHSALAAAEPSGFLDDYDQLRADPGFAADRVYLVPDAADRFARYDAVMVDQPEVFIASDSRYRGMKPDDLKLLADSFRSAVTDELSETYRIAEEPGPGVLYLRFATTDLQLRKTRNLLDFTPVGVVTNVVPGVRDVKSALRSAVIKDFSRRVSLIELTIEAELLDSVSGERIAALVAQLGQRRDREAGLEQRATSWEEAEQVVRTYGSRLVCRLDNARKEPEQRGDCSLLGESSASPP
ncbi:MAG: DUF3313 domain-containing protein [Pseudomonadales bacterium]|jgi:hypothetical protein|nr:DUF3313 domain-containing protein [Pseudomonadales bacterium]